MPTLSAGVLALAMALISAAHAAPPLDGATVYQNNCGRCHLPRTPADLPPSAWRAVSFHMRVKANLTPAEFAAIEDFLVPVERSAETVPAAGVPDSLPVEQEPTVGAACLTCHDAERVQAAVDTGRDRAGWDATLKRMRAYGAKLNAEEADSLATWLADEAPERGDR